MKLAEIFQNGVILQAGKPIRIFGEGEGKITVSLNGAFAETVAEGGHWVASLPAMEYGGAYTLTVCGENSMIEISDVYVGEVILFSGQSNIQFHMNEEITPPEKYTDDDMLRIFVSLRLEDEEWIHPSDGWVKARVDNIDHWSALAYLVGRDLREKGAFAVGVVACSQGASVIQAWIDEKLITGTDIDVPLEKRHFDSKYEPFQVWNSYGRLYHFMLEPLIPFSFGGVVWYQGESNASECEGEIYCDMLEVMIENWRDRFSDEKLKFFVVQLADYTDSVGWKKVQKAQLEAENRIDGVKTLICADICEAKEIHPPTKWKLAERIVEAYR